MSNKYIIEIFYPIKYYLTFSRLIPEITEGSYTPPLKKDGVIQFLSASGRISEDSLLSAIDFAATKANEGISLFVIESKKKVSLQISSITETLNDFDRPRALKALGLTEGVSRVDTMIEALKNFTQDGAYIPSMKGEIKVLSKTLV